MRGNLIAMNTQELDHASIIQLVLDKRLTQVRRLCRSVRCEGCQGLRSNVAGGSA